LCILSMCQKSIGYITTSLTTSVRNEHAKRQNTISKFYLL